MSGRQHKIIVDGADRSWQRIVTVENFRRAARGIYNLVQADLRQGQTRLDVPSTLTLETLERLITWIDRGIPYGQLLTFLELLQLSTAIWHYRCNPAYFRNLASHSYERVDTSRPLGQKAAGCAFITLTFDWRDDFKETTRQLIFSFDSKVDVIEGVPYFPPALKHAIVSARRDLIRKTFAFIKSDVVRYARELNAFAHINNCLYSNGIDIALLDTEYEQAAVADVDNDGGIRCVRSPGRMLDILESILLDEPQVGQPLLPPLVHEAEAESSNSSSANGTVSGVQTGPSSTMGFVEGQHVATLRGDSAVNEGSLRRFISSYINRKRRSMGEDRRRPLPRWDQGAVDQFQAVAARLRRQVASRRFTLFGDNLGLYTENFYSLRREKLLITQGPTH